MPAYVIMYLYDITLKFSVNVIQDCDYTCTYLSHTEGPHMLDSIHNYTDLSYLYRRHGCKDLASTHSHLQLYRGKVVVRL